MEYIICIIMIISAFLAIETQLIRNSIIFLEVLSLLSVVAYITLQAPDVAIAEIVIGSIFSTILFLVALKEKKSLELVL